MKWTKEDSKLLNEMKDRCLNKGQYVDEKAKDKFKLLCHLEDFVIQYYELEKDYKRAMRVIDKGVENTYKKVKDLEKENKNLKWERDSYYEDIICYIKNTMHVSDKKARKTFDEVSEDWSSSTIYHTLCELDEGDE